MLWNRKRKKLDVSPTYNICEMVTLAKTHKKELYISGKCQVAMACGPWQQVLFQSSQQELPLPSVWVFSDDQARSGMICQIKIPCLYHHPVAILKESTDCSIPKYMAVTWVWETPRCTSRILEKEAAPHSTFRVNTRTKEHSALEQTPESNSCLQHGGHGSETLFSGVLERKVKILIMDQMVKKKSNTCFLIL